MCPAEGKWCRRLKITARDELFRQEYVSIVTANCLTIMWMHFFGAAGNFFILPVLNSTELNLFQWHFSFSRYLGVVMLFWEFFLVIWLKTANSFQMPNKHHLAVISYYDQALVKTMEEKLLKDKIMVDKNDLIFLKLNDNLNNRKPWCIPKTRNKNKRCLHIWTFQWLVNILFQIGL